MKGLRPFVFFLLAAVDSTLHFDYQYSTFLSRTMEELPLGQASAENNSWKQDTDSWLLVPVFSHID